MLATIYLASFLDVEDILHTLREEEADVEPLSRAEKASNVDVKVQKARKQVDLTKVPMFNWDETYEAFKSKAPQNPSEIVDWMIYSAAYAVVINNTADGYSSVGSLLTGSGDAYIPGVSVEDAAYLSEPAHKIADRGYARAYVSSNNSVIVVPTFKRTMDRKHIRQFLVARLFGIQWLGLLAKIRQRARAPFSDANIVISTVRTQNNRLLTFPVIQVEYSMRPVIRMLRLTMSYKQPVPVELVFYDSSMSEAYVVDVDAPADPGTYDVYIVGYGLPTSGVFEVYADGNPTSVVLHSVSNRVLG